MFLDIYGLVHSHSIYLLWSDGTDGLHGGEGIYAWLWSTHVQYG